jgi:hypothetical protein
MKMSICMKEAVQQNTEPMTNIHAPKVTHHGGK